MYCFVNPELNAPFQTEFDRMTDISEFNEEFIANYLDARNVPAMLDRYYFQRQVHWNQIYQAHHMHSQVNSGDQSSLEDVRAWI